MPPQIRAERPHGNSDVATLKLLGVVIPLSFLPVLAFRFAGEPLSNGAWNPLGLLALLATGKRAWPLAATIILIALVVVVFVAVVGVALWWGKQRFSVAETASDRRLDRLAATMPAPRSVRETSPAYLAQTADRLAGSIPSEHPARNGLLVGVTVAGRRELRSPWEWVIIAIAGARMGKTAALAIPAACAAPGALVATSNKKDLYTHTAGVRSVQGRVWLFDLQGVTTGNPRSRATFWFNPLLPVVDLPSAKVVGGYFISSAVAENARVDAYFDGNARDLLGSYILAAALASGDLRHVVEWLIDTQSRVPVTVLETHGYRGLAETMRGKQAVNARQRDGFYDMARRFLAPLDEPRFAEAVLPCRRTVIGVDMNQQLTFMPGEYVHRLEEFNPPEFVRIGIDTVYALSKEGEDSASAIATALIGAILEAADHHGAAQPSGRLDVPLVAVLDEAANICRLQQLPDWYSHYGSRGIIPITILQSPSQGKRVWGETRYAAMCDAANLEWYGGNVADDGYLDSLSKSIGDHYVRTESHTASLGVFNGGAGSRQAGWERERIFDTSDLKALPSGRAIVTLAGSKPLLVRKVFWQDTPWAERIEQSVCDYSGAVRQVSPGGESREL
ncbi:MAG: TraM recognition domain-containing protein [Nocardiaceae bacterium]|nr:TraM recognition domain-containing protein [Nocardiaceae bacterium]